MEPKILFPADLPEIVEELSKKSLEQKANEEIIKVVRSSKLTTEELKELLTREPSIRYRTKKIKFSRQHFKYGYFSDCHIGHEKFREDLFMKAVELYKREHVDFIIDTGDHLEGMSGRHGQIYELTHLGFEQQMGYAEQLYNELPVKTYGIDGNHDAWYKKKMNGGLIVGKELGRRVKNYEHLGEMEGDLNINNVKIKLFHANDMTAYATSYKLQKLIESFSGGEKPNILHSGHYHKALYMFLRNVHGFESGCLMGQSEWMRGKKIQAHIGFGVVDVYINKNGVERLIHEFYAGYE